MVHAEKLSSKSRVEMDRVSKSVPINIFFRPNQTVPSQVKLKSVLNEQWNSKRTLSDSDVKWTFSFIAKVTKKKILA